MQIARDPSTLLRSLDIEAYTLAVAPQPISYVTLSSSFIVPDKISKLAIKFKRLVLQLYP